jgi:hypothetical protein
MPLPVGTFQAIMSIWAEARAEQNRRRAIIAIGFIAVYLRVR